MAWLTPSPTNSQQKSSYSINLQEIRFGKLRKLQRNKPLQIKIYANILKDKLHTHYKYTIREEQNGFHKGR